MGAEIYRKEGDRITFPTLVDVSTFREGPIDLAAAEPFGQPNESGGLRPVQSLDEVCEIARKAAVSTKRLFDL